ncbi:DNA polymerase III subunit gamma/tau [soil metagenome]
MEQYVVSARKYRPRKFEDVVGQEGVTNTLKNAIRSGHLAHALLFCGPRGVGKTTCARILARMINSTHPVDSFDPANEPAIDESFNVYELDAASNNSVDDIRALVDQVRIPPQGAKYKVYIIDEVHMLSTAAFNAFLKTLEEPPPYAIFILATTEKHKIIPTILSRCQIYDFNRITIDDTVNHLEGICKTEGITADPNALHIIAQKADGALRDALSLFDRLVDYTTRQLTYDSVLVNLNILDYDYFFRITDQLLSQDLAGLMLSYDEIVRKGFEGDTFIGGLADHFRNLMVARDPQTIKVLEVSGDLKERYQQQSVLVPMGFLINALNLAAQCEVTFKSSRNKRLQVELALMKMCYLPAAMQLASNGEATKKNSTTEQITAPQPTQKPVNQPQAISATQVAEPIPKPLETPNSKATSENGTGSMAPPPNTNNTAKPMPTMGAACGLLGMPSLKRPQAAEIAPKKEEDAENNAPVEEIDTEKLAEAWAAYKEKLGDENKISMQSLVERSLYRLVEGKVVVVLGNTVERDLFEPERVPFKEYLQNKLGVQRVAVEVEVDRSLAEANVPRKAFSSKEKLAQMAEKNPAILKLKDNLDLKFDL